MRTKLVKLLDRVLYYEWAYGHLGEQDADVGVIGEFLVGKILRCLPRARSVNSLFDLELKRGERTYGIEVKTTSARAVHHKGKTVAYEWRIKTQKACLEGKRPLAPIWTFLAADFPTAKAVRRSFDPFDEKYWTVWVVTGEQMLASKVKNRVTEATLKRLGVEAHPLAEMKVVVAAAIKAQTVEG